MIYDVGTYCIVKDFSLLLHF